MNFLTESVRKAILIDCDARNTQNGQGDITLHTPVREGQEI